MKVVLSSQVAADLRSIGRFIARENPARAVSFVRDLQAVIARLVDLPHGFPLVPRYERDGIRRRSWKGYGILYATPSGCVFVYRIVGPGQDHDRALGLR